MPAKRTSSTETGTDWNEVIAKALTYLVVNSPGLKDKKVTEKATFLMGLGLARKDAAAVLGSTDDSLRVNLPKKTPKRAKKSTRPRKNPG
jgi:hypothetical protein